MKKKPKLHEFWWGIVQKGKVVLLFAAFFFFLGQSVWAQTNTVTGTVKNTSGQPLPGVTITVLGETRGVITDVDGKFSIEVKPTDKLAFSFIGMESQIIDVGNQKSINVKLEEKSEELEDITVVAFGKQKKESVISSITTVKPQDLKDPIYLKYH